MKKLALVSLFVVGALFMGALSPLDAATKLTLQRVADMTSLLLRLNGVPRAAGVLTSTGTSVTQATTGAPFTLPTGTCFEISCDGTGVMNFGSAAALAYTSANHGHYMAANTPWYPCSQDTDTSLAFISTTGTVNCNVRTVR